jgi:protein-export membrane protein SecD
MDDLMISAPTVQAEINDGKAQITGMESYEAAKELADNINAGALPFAVSADSSKLQIIAPTLGNDALQVMVIAAVIAFAIICLIMLFKYRLPGFIACITLMGQAAVMVAASSGFFDTWESFTLTVPGIAGMILSIGMGVDSNVITSERIREELANGKTLDSAIDKGYSNAFSAILDGNITNVLVAIVLMGAFGTTDGIFYKLFSWVLGFFTSSIAGSIYSFGYTLIVGVIANFIMAVFWSKILLKGIARFKVFRKPWLYGGAK